MNLKFMILFILYSIFVLILGMVIGYCFGWYEFKYCEENDDEFEIEDEEECEN